MTRALAVLRPEPGNAATAARIAALGLVAIRLPLFAVRALDWKAPDPAAYDALLLTSANAVRHGGDALVTLWPLPVFAVGEATAAAARARGFTVAATGDGGAEAIVARAAGRRLLHLTGSEHRAVAGVEAIAVYASEPLAIDPAPIEGQVALVHSPRAAAALAAIAERPRVRVAAISAAAAAAAGAGWAGVAVAAAPTDHALIAAARRLAD